MSTAVPMTSPPPFPPAVAVWLRNPKKKGATARLLLLLHQQTRPLDRYIYNSFLVIFFFLLVLDVFAGTGATTRGAAAGASNGV